MTHLHSHAAVGIARNPIHAALAPFPIVCFTLTLLTDIAYWQSSTLMWQYFSEWLLLVGLIFGVLAALAGAVDFLSRPELRAWVPAWPQAVGSVSALALAFVNSLVHAADGWTGVFPYGLILSLLTVLVMIVGSWLGRSLVYRHDVGVSRNE